MLMLGDTFILYQTWPHSLPSLPSFLASFEADICGYVLALGWLSAKVPNGDSVKKWALSPPGSPQLSKR